MNWRGWTDPVRMIVPAGRVVPWDMKAINFGMEKIRSLVNQQSSSDRPSEDLESFLMQQSSVRKKAGDASR